MPNPSDESKGLIQGLIQKNKVLGYFVLFIIILLLFVLMYGLFNDILVNENIFIYYWTNWISFFLTIFTLYHLSKPNSKMRKNIEKRNKSVALTVLSFIIFIPLVTKLFLEHSVPFILHELVKKPDKIDVVIRNKISRKACRRGVKLEGYMYFMNGKVCGFPKKKYLELSDGDILTLKGESSYFGFTYDTYILKEKYASIKYTTSDKERVDDLKEFADYLKETNK